MTYPALTAFYAALLAFVYIALAGWVVAGRFRTNTLHGDDGGMLARRVRGHGNFGEYVPLALGLIALLEMGGASSTLVRTLLVVLLVARIAHPVGMVAPPNTPQQFACRGGGTVATFGVILVAAAALLLR
jgi:uncharacterized membrane protein YecN with MAPEG domain